jgi:hypothetical protein
MIVSLIVTGRYALQLLSVRYYSQRFKFAYHQYQPNTSNSTYVYPSDST